MTVAVRAGSPVRIDVRHEADAGAVRSEARRLAAAAGLDDRGCEEVALVATELATNLLRHAGGGSIVLEAIEEGSRTGLEIQSLDRGPGIASVARVVTDGYSTVAGLGLGLGTVNRLMDDLQIEPADGGGTRVTCRRWVRPAKGVGIPAPVRFGAATRTHPAHAVNGDQFVVRTWNDGALIGVIDGVGHGPDAHAASSAVRQYVEAHCDQPLEAIFRGAELACRSTRGAVMALARFDWRGGAAPDVDLHVANVGNGAVRMFGGIVPGHGEVRRGILGMGAPAALVTAHRWADEGILVLHTDGMRSRWDLADFPGLGDAAPSEIAWRLMDALGTRDDDATVVVARGGCPGGKR